MYILGCDIGATSIKTVVLDELNNIELSMYNVHNGDVIGTFNSHISKVMQKYYTLIKFAGISGNLANDFCNTYKQNNISSLIEGIKLIIPNCNSIINIGGESACYISNIQHNPKFSINCSCAAGTGTFIEDQLSRLNVNLESIKELILKSTYIPLIAGRCSVFAKTDIIHRQQEGCSIENIINGLCYSMVRNYKASIIRGSKIESPIVFSGGVSKNFGVLNAFQKILKDNSIIADELSLYYQAIGTALLSKKNGIRFDINTYKLKTTLTSKMNLPQLVLNNTEYTHHKLYDFDKTKNHYLGIDIGSTSINLVVIDENRKVVSIQYLRASGRPLDIVQEGIKNLYKKFEDIKIKAIGTTGSGRLYIGKKLNTSYIKDEITSQAKGIKEYTKDVDTVFEIGGQDSKFIRINNSGVEDFQMNKVCAAGTGSFVEEQAKRLNISLDDYGPLSLSSKHPQSLGERCTVFIQSSVEKSLSEGENIADIASGVCYSIVHNYLHKVVGNRKLGTRICLSGGVCFNYGIVAAFKYYFPNLIVSPYFSVTGAIGIALITLEEYSRAKYKCISKTSKKEIAINRLLLSKTKRNFIGSYKEFHDIKKKTIGIPRALMNYKLFPLAYGFFSSLGFNVLLSPETNEDIIKRSQDLAIEETCYPVKLILGHISYLIDQKVDAIFLPSVFTMKHENSSLEHDYGCVFMQGASEIIGKLLDLESKNIKLLNPILEIHMGKPQFAKAMIEIGLSLGCSKLRCTYALSVGGKNLLTVTEKSERIGKKLLSNINENEKVLVLVSRTYGIDDEVLSMGIKEKLLSYGYKVITLAHLQAHNEEIEDSYPNLYWPFAQHILGGIKQIKENSNLYAVYLTNHGCGPDTIISHYVSEIMKDKPYLSIEVDEHYSKVGLITRIEAFLTSINNNHIKFETRKTLPYIKNNYFEDINSYINNSDNSSILNISNFYPFSHLFSNLLNSKGIKSKVMSESCEESLFRGKSETRSKEYVSLYSLVGDILYSQPQKKDDYLIFQNMGTEVDGQIARLSRTILDRNGFVNNKILTMCIENQEKNYDLLFTFIYGDLLLYLEDKSQQEYINEIPTKQNIELLIRHINKQEKKQASYYLYGDPRCLFNKYLCSSYIQKIKEYGDVEYMSLTECFITNLYENNRDITEFINIINYFNSLFIKSSPLFGKKEVRAYLNNITIQANKSVKKIATLNGRFRIAKANEKKKKAIQFSPMYENLSILIEMDNIENFFNISIDGTAKEICKLETFLAFE